MWSFWKFSDQMVHILTVALTIAWFRNFHWQFEFHGISFIESPRVTVNNLYRRRWPVRSWLIETPNQFRRCWSPWHIESNWHFMTNTVTVSFNPVNLSKYATSSFPKHINIAFFISFLNIQFYLNRTKCDYFIFLQYK